IQDVQKQFGLTVVLIAHEPRVIATVCDRVAVLDKGLVVETGPVGAVFSNPSHEITKGFVQDLLGGADLARDVEAKGRLVRIALLGRPLPDSLLAGLFRDFKVEARILKAHVEQVKGAPLGALVLDLLGEPEDVDKAYGRLQSQGLAMEEEP
ncbi:MAG: methionine ABC transporter ATP-binding protein, partial [Deltaproteobacteria bacterium]|nr:methionine ABC transporter ATP-binding protein [Deltaproteobacteria bacterium]